MKRNLSIFAFIAVLVFSILACYANYPGFTKEDILGVKAGGILDWEYNMSPYGGRGPNGWAAPYTIPSVITHFADHNEAGGAYNDPNFWGQLT